MVRLILFKFIFENVAETSSSVMYSRQGLLLESQEIPDNWRKAVCRADMSRNTLRKCPKIGLEF